MPGILIYGIQKAAIGIDEVMESCPSCEHDTYCDAYITSDYYHMFYIPIFPIGKEVSLFCQKCGLRRHDIPLKRSTLKNYTALNTKYRHPWYTYLVPLFCALITLIVILFAKW